MLTELEIELELGMCHGSMNVVVSDQQGIIGELIDYQSTQSRISHKIMLPNQLQFKIFGKNYNTDTKLAQDGSILEDKYVKLTKLVLGRIPIGMDKFYKICRFQTDLALDPVYDPAWHYNGTVTIDFDQNNFVKYLLIINNTFRHK